MMCSEAHSDKRAFIILKNDRDVVGFKVTAREDITFVEEPVETASIDFTMMVSSPADGMMQMKSDIVHDFEYNLEVKFKNNLHDVSKDYRYIITFYACVRQSYDPEDTNSRHQVLFSHDKIREADTMEFEDTFHMSNVADKIFSPSWDTYPSVWHICCVVHRKKQVLHSQTAVLPIQNSIGAMLLSSRAYSDISLVVGDRNFPAHKRILSMHSAVFEAMFSHDMVENQHGVVSIEDLDPIVVEELLAFIYTGKTEALSEMPLDLLKAAHKYQIIHLQNLCLEHLMFQLDCQNVIKIITAVTLFDLHDMRVKLLEFLRIHRAEMVMKKEYRQFLIDDLNIDTVTNTLKICAVHTTSFGEVEKKAFEFIGKHKKALAKNQEFLKFLKSEPDMMIKLYFSDG